MSQHSPASTPQPALPSKCEPQVLHLLSSRLSGLEIVEEIHLDPTNVRAHVQNIYRKLDVHGRIEALQRAEELGLRLSTH